MRVQAELRSNYHEYLQIANELPNQMRECGVFEVQLPIMRHNLTFSHEGTIRVDNSEPLALNSVDRILYACFAKDESGLGYQSKPKNLQQVVPEHMKILRLAISEARKSLEDFAFYKG